MSKNFKDNKFYFDSSNFKLNLTQAQNPNSFSTEIKSHKLNCPNGSSCIGMANFEDKGILVHMIHPDKTDHIYYFDPVKNVSYLIDDKKKPPTKWRQSGDTC